MACGVLKNCNYQLLTGPELLAKIKELGEVATVQANGNLLVGIAWGRTSRPFHLNKITGPLRRALIYGAVSYGGLVLINNSELNLPNMWVAYLPMFVGVYVLTLWLDRKFGG